MNTCSNCGRYVGTEHRFCPHCGSGTDGSDSHSLEGRVLSGKYRVLSQLGAGSMGRVYLGEHVQLQKKVALKVLRPDLSVTEESLKRFQREGVTAGQFSHPNVIQIFDFDRAGSVSYLAMEYVEGRSLAGILRDRGPLPVPLALRLIRQVLSALAAAHARSVIHRDLKPDNIMVTGDLDGEPLVKVLDFGLSKLIDQGDEASLVTQTGMILGTPLYMSPEQCAGEEVDHRSDLFSVGLILFEMLAGGLPLRGQNVSRILLERATREVPPLLSVRPELRIPADLERVVRKALQRELDQRYASADEMIRDLDRVRMDGASAAPPEQPDAADAPPLDPAAPTLLLHRSRTARPGRSRAWVAVAAGAAVLAAVGLAWTLLPGDGASEPIAAARVRERPADGRSAEESRYLGLLDDARAALRANQLEEAQILLDRAHQSPQRDAEAFLVRADLFRHRGDREAALLDYTEALHLDRSYAAAAVGIGWMELERGSRDRARERFQAALQQEPGAAEPRVGLAAVALAEDDPVAASGLLDEALARDPECARGWYFRGRLLLSRSDVEGARAALVQAKRLDPLHGPTYAALGQAYLRLGRDDEAERELGEALRHNPGAASTALELAALHLLRERFAEAVRVADEALTRHPREGRLHLVRGMALAEQDQPVAAVRALEQGFALGVDDARARSLLQLLYLTQGRPMDALRLGESNGEVEPGLATPHLIRGVTLFRLQRFDEAGAAFEAALAAEPDMAFAHRALGILYMDYLPDPDGRAELHLRRYLDLNGPDERVLTWLGRLGTRG